MTVLHGPALAWANVMTQEHGLKGVWKAIFELPGTTGSEALMAAEIVARTEREAHHEVCNVLQRFLQVPGGTLEDIANLMLSFPLCLCSLATCADQDHCCSPRTASARLNRTADVCLKPRS